ncbi:sigma-70 family RNA polymerase sigma factor [Cellulomonas alba]|uniref:Sigma-70 family RNA polymerase sigma factor n=1 Tax=Cellulomonas alba TaxID=3053467 RepID=A0ABT7SG08_9CELL|nr:sigma-70 family RNA polymerase sigma factor [Cellulomonas alba]MDM7855127.1 sigma-70 family RNA polymerase sigma factor [Cellulomonas alba]
MGRWEPLLETLVRERYARLLARAALVAATPAEAEDLVQDALVATFGGRARFGSVEQAEQYVRRAIVSRSIDRARSRTSERRAVERLAGRTDAAAAEPALAGVDRDLVAALHLLGPRERACVVLRHLDDLSVAQTAAALRLSDGAVKRYTSDGLALLAAHLGATADADRTPVRLVRTESTRDA